MTAQPEFIEQVAGTDKTFRVSIEQLDSGLNTRAYPHTLPDRFLTVADNVVFLRDGLVSKRPGNIAYGNGTGITGGGQPVSSVARFYPVAGPPKLLAHSGVNLYAGNDATGAFTLINAGMTSGARETYAQMFDPDMTSGAAAALFICDGKRIPQQWDGVNFVPVQTGGVFFPNGPTGNPITPQFCTDWGYHMVYAGDPTDPTAIWISDAMRPQRFTGISYVDSGGSSYLPFYPAGRSGTMGVITGLVPISANSLLIFYTNGIVVAQNTGTVGAFEFAFSIISRRIGCPSPFSIVPFDNYVVFFGGDRFYATNGSSMQPLPDRIPTIYARNSQSAQPPEIFDITKVVAFRHGTQYVASYTIDNTGSTRRAVVFDTASRGGFMFGFFPRGYDEDNGGAWSRWLGMNVNCAVECRGPGDTFQVFWGASDSDLVAQFDPVGGAHSDFGNPISLELRAKAFTMNKLYAPKMLEAMYLILVYDASSTYTSTVTAYIVRDQIADDAQPLSVEVTPQGTLYGEGNFGDFNYESSASVLQTTLKAYPSAPTQAFSIAPGLVESSTHPFNLIGFAMELIVDDPF